MKRFVRYGLPLLAYAGLIFYLSSRSSVPSLQLPGFDKVVHFSEYLGLAVLTARALTAYAVPRGISVAAAIALCSAYGASDEVHQASTPNRVSDVRDWVADTMGAAAGALGWYAIGRRRFGSAEATR